MARTDYVQYNFRLNLNKPEHLKIYRVLTDLNLDIHKSRTNFIIDALSRYINGVPDENLTNEGERSEYITRQDLEQMEFRITEKVMQEVARIVGRAVMESHSFANPFMQMVPQAWQGGQQVYVPQGTGQAGEDTENPDKALEEMAMLFSQDNYGEE